jgi:diaminopimelate dehydrogenase
MKQRKRLAVIGLGNLSSACVRAISHSDDFRLAGVVRRGEELASGWPADLGEIPVVEHVSELDKVEVALICVPTEEAGGAAHDLLQRRIAVVDSVALHEKDLLQHREELDKYAVHFRSSAIVGAGWDPGGLSLVRNLFALLVPKGHTWERHRVSRQLHRITLAGEVPGVRDVAALEVRDSADARQRYVYVELAEGADPARVESAIRGDPLWAGEKIQVFAVESIAALQDEAHGVLLERYGSAASVDHQDLLFEARVSEEALSAQMMLAAARLLPSAKHRAYSLFDIPPAALWGELSAQAEHSWL